MNEQYECTIKGIPSICEVSVHHPPPGDPLLVQMEPLVLYESENITDGHIINDR